MPDVSLDDKYTASTGEVVMTGIQALVRLPMDQHRLDRSQGLRTATLVSGYRGSPLGGLDMAFGQARKLVEEHHIRFLAGVNEDLAATAIFGSQLANNFPNPKYDGVLGMWYGKGPGVDRSGDAFRHGNVAGVGRNGGVLAVAGDDPGAKSSTVASASEFALLDAGMPVLYPGTVREVLQYGLAGFALSRFCGSWVGLKIVTNVADAFSTVALNEPQPFVVPEVIVNDRAWRPVQNPRLVAPDSVEQEREMHEGRAQAVLSFLAANQINELVADPDDAWLGVVAAGKTYRDLIDALDSLGLDISGAAALGVRILKLGAIHPIEPGIVRHFARGLEEIFVVEEKRAFVELFLRDALYGVTGAPRIVGKRDEHGTALLPGHGELDADRIRPALSARLTARISADRLRPLPVRALKRQLIPLTSAESRTPYFCSGCPHNRSTVVPDGSIANGAVGCSTMAMWMDRKTDNIVQMGAEGAHWIGAAPFTETSHIFQNMGDGTFLHSGSLAVRQAVASGANLTYKLLYNAAVAMTGGQRHDADLPLGDIVRSLLAEGVTRVLVVSDNPDARRDELPSGVDVLHRDRVIEAQEVLRVIPGVTVMVYDQACAADLRRKRKRGLAETPKHRIMINEAVCEGCGDCGAKSNCLSVQPVDTLLGRKTRIHQASCNLDVTCTTGHCPAFVKVVPGPTTAAGKRSRRSESSTVLPEPTRVVGESVNVVMTGVGGTGVVTINQILGVAARLAGMYSTGLDQTGLAQKGGSVVSHLRLSSTPIEGANLVQHGGADVLLAFDPITAAQDVHLGRISADRSRAVVNRSMSPTGPQVRDVRAAKPEVGILLERLEAATLPGSLVPLDAEALAQDLFGDNMPANMIVVGAAYQSGLLPLDASAIERAIELNGAAVATNLAAFRAGRRAIAEPTSPPAATSTRTRRGRELPARVTRLLADVPSEARELVEFCATNLIDYQSVGYSERFAVDVARVVAVEPSGRSELTQVAARCLHHLMAYKDEYEVARLHRSQRFADDLRSEFGDGAATTHLLQPPSLSRFGLRRKLELRRSASVAFPLLAASRRLRGTPFDLFGRSAHRRMERGLADEFRTHIDIALDHLASANDTNREAAYQRVVDLLTLADDVRGFDHIKERNVDAWRAAARAAIDALSSEFASTTF